MGNSSAAYRRVFAYEAKATSIQIEPCLPADLGRNELDILLTWKTIIMCRRFLLYYKLLFSISLLIKNEHCISFFKFNIIVLVSVPQFHSVKLTREGKPRKTCLRFEYNNYFKTYELHPYHTFCLLRC